MPEASFRFSLAPAVLERVRGSVRAARARRGRRGGGLSPSSATVSVHVVDAYSRGRGSRCAP